MPSEEFIHLHDIEPRTGAMAAVERFRHRQAHWLAECAAEAMGAFLYCFAGGSVQAAFIIGNVAQLTGLSSLLSVGFGYMAGIVFALVVCSATSGGHFNPCMTLISSINMTWCLDLTGRQITYVVFHKFPLLKAFRYIVAQIFGAFVAFGFIYLQYKPLIMEVEAALVAKGVWETVGFTAQGPVGIFALFAPAGYPIGTVFLNEFVVDFMLALVIFGCLDPTNLLVPPAMGVWVVALAYAVAIWGFSVNGLAANSARDIGGRILAVAVWGSKASGGSYGAIAALTNIPATLLAALFYRVVLSDSQRVVNPAQKQFRDAHLAHEGRVKRIIAGEELDDVSSTEKVDISMIEERRRQEA